MLGEAAEKIFQVVVEAALLHDVGKLPQVAIIIDVRGIAQRPKGDRLVGFDDAVGQRGDRRAFRRSISLNGQ